MTRAVRIMSGTPSWIVLVAMFLALGTVLGLLSWAAASILPNVDQDMATLVTFLLGMFAGDIAMPVWVAWYWERKVGQ